MEDLLPTKLTSLVSTCRQISQIIWFTEDIMIILEQQLSLLDKRGESVVIKLCKIVRNPFVCMIALSNPGEKVVTDHQI